jgi:DNA-binding winged helix-turn-helix (wHTH) protein
MPASALLILQDAPGVTSAEWDLQARTTTIGRAETSRVVLADREVSRHHAEVRHADDRYVLVDLGSRNGTFVNGRRITGAVALVDGDEISIAPRFRLLFVDNDATLATRPMPYGVHVDATSRTVTVAGRVVDPPLAPQQFALLQLLASDPSRVFTRDEIAATCYPDALGGVSDQAIDGVVRRLRARLTALVPAARYLVTVRGHGLRLRD